MKIIAGIIAVIVIILMGLMFVIDQKEQAIVLQFGEPVRVLNASGKEDEPGLKFKRPFFLETVLFLDKRILDLDAEAREVIAKDQKRLIVDAFGKYRITDPLKFYQTVRDERGARLRLNAILDSRLREVVGNNLLSSLLTDKRAEMMHQIRSNVNKEAGAFGIQMVDVRIRRADLPKENSDKVFNRMRTEREREAKEFRAQGAEEAQRITSRAERERTILLANAQKEASITRGKGDADASRIFAQSYSSDAEFYEFYRTMQAYRASLKQGDTSLVLSPDSEFFKYFRSDEGK